MLQILGIGPNGPVAQAFRRYPGEKQRLSRELESFIQWKQQHPFNGATLESPGFGDSDKKFRSIGNFSTVVPGISHAHLTHNLSVVYRIEDNKLNIYGIYSHDELGTGNPANQQRQKQMATRFANMELQAGELQQPTAKTATAKTTTGNVDYTPKQKQPVQQPAQQKERDPFYGFVKMVDQQWPERNFFRQMQQAQDKYSKLMLINKEAHYLNIVKQKHKLFPNQVEYLKGLQGLLNYLTKQQK